MAKQGSDKNLSNINESEKNVITNTSNKSSLNYDQIFHGGGNRSQQEYNHDRGHRNVQQMLNFVAQRGGVFGAVESFSNQQQVQWNQDTNNLMGGSIGPEHAVSFYLDPQATSQNQRDRADEFSLKDQFRKIGAKDDTIEIGIPLVKKYSDDKTSNRQKEELMYTIRDFRNLGGNAEQTHRYIAAIKGEIGGLEKTPIGERSKLDSKEEYCEKWIDRLINKRIEESKRGEIEIKPYRPQAIFAPPEELSLTSSEIKRYEVLQPVDGDNNPMAQYDDTDIPFVIKDSSNNVYYLDSEHKGIHKKYKLIDMKQSDSGKIDATKDASFASQGDISQSVEVIDSIITERAHKIVGKKISKDEKQVLKEKISLLNGYAKIAEYKVLNKDKSNDPAEIKNGNVSVIQSLRVYRDKMINNSYPADIAEKNVENILRRYNELPAQLQADLKEIGISSGFHPIE